MRESFELDTDSELVFDDELLDDYAPTRVLVHRPHDRASMAALPDHVVYPRQMQSGDLLAGKYRVQRVHRSSVLGVTVEALHVQLGQRVALRLLLADHHAYPEATTRFLRGVRLAAQFQSEHTARIIDVGSLESGEPYVVSEFLAGSDLQRVLRVRETLTVPEAVDYLLEACEGLATAHAHRMVHKNLKPSNLFLSHSAEGKRLTVLDFGVSDDPLTDATINLGGTHGAMKAFAYLAPEQIREPSSVDARADIWALGAILHEMLCGAPLYAAATTPALLAMIAADPPVPLSHLRPEIPAGLEAVVQRSVAKDREDRFRDLSELAQALSPFASAQGLRSVERVVKAGVRRIPSARPPRLPNEQLSRAIVRVATAAPAPEATVRAVSARRWADLALTGLGLAAAGALGVFVAVRVMESTLASALASRPLIAELSPALPAPAPGIEPRSASPVASVAASAAPVAPVAKVLTTVEQVEPAPPPVNAAPLAPTRPAPTLKVQLPLQRAVAVKRSSSDPPLAAVAHAEPVTRKPSVGAGLFDDAN